MGVWDETTPAGTDPKSQGDDRIRELKVALGEALSEEGVFPGTAPLTAPVFKWTGKRGATVGRPGSPSTGEIYFNTELFQMEYYNGAAWVAYDMVPLLGITTAKINDLAVTTGKIAASAVTDAKINDVAFGKITGTVTPSNATVTDAKIVDVAVGKITGILPLTKGGNGVSHLIMNVVSWAGNGATPRDIAHGLGVTPMFVMIIRTDSTGANPPVTWITGSAYGRWCTGLGNYGDGIKSANSTNVVIGAHADINAAGGSYAAIVLAPQA